MVRPALTLLLHGCFYATPAEEVGTIPDCAVATCTASIRVELVSLQACFLHAGVWEVPSELQPWCGAEPIGPCVVAAEARRYEGSFPCYDCLGDPVAACEAAFFEVAVQDELMQDDQSGLIAGLWDHCPSLRGEFDVTCATGGE